MAMTRQDAGLEAEIEEVTTSANELNNIWRAINAANERMSALEKKVADSMREPARKPIHDTVRDDDLTATRNALEVTKHELTMVRAELAATRESAGRMKAELEKVKLDLILEKAAAERQRKEAVGSLETLLRNVSDQISWIRDGVA